MKILLIGKTGQLGGSILRENTSHQIYSPDRVELDIESIESCKRAISKCRPNVVINTAAFHNVPQCEEEPHRAFEVNCLAVRDLASLCKKADILLVTFSTDYVFDGDQNSPYHEDHQTNPLQMYGISRLAGELATLAIAPKHVVVIRTSGLYGLSGAKSKGGNFVDKRIADVQTHTQLEMSCDQVISPTYTDDLAKAVLKLIKHPKVVPGIYHLVNRGECTWFEFTKAIYEIIALHMEVHPVDRGGMSGEMRRPLYSVMLNTKAQAMGIELPHWRNALQRYLKEKYGATISK